MFDLIADWLERHSTAVERVRNEIRYTHSEKRTSVLVVRDEWLDDMIPVTAEPLRSFYQEGLAASIGGGHIFIGSAVEGGIEVSHGYIIPDLPEMRSQAAGLGMKNTEGMEVFMAEANWMFLYGFDPENGHLVRFDRDFDDYTSVSGVEEVLNDWWQLVIVDDEDLAKRFPGV